MAHYKEALELLGLLAPSSQVFTLFAPDQLGEALWRSVLEENHPDKARRDEAQARHRKVTLACLYAVHCFVFFSTAKSFESINEDSICKSIEQTGTTWDMDDVWKSVMDADEENSRLASATLGKAYWNAMTDGLLRYERFTRTANHLMANSPNKSDRRMPMTTPDLPDRFLLIHTIMRLDGADYINQCCRVHGLTNEHVYWNDRMVRVLDCVDGTKKVAT